MKPPTTSWLPSLSFSTSMIIVSLTLNNLISEMKALPTILGLYQFITDSLYVPVEINPLICIYGIPNPKTLK
jgi:hypothetical protein